MSVTIALEPARQSAVIDLLEQSDRYMEALYPRRAIISSISPR